MFMTFVALLIEIRKRIERLKVKPLLLRFFLKKCKIANSDIKKIKNNRERKKGGGDE